MEVVGNKILKSQRAKTATRSPKNCDRSNQFEGSDGAAHPPQNRPMDMATTRDLKGPSASLGVDGTIPRVCAVRGPTDGQGSNHGKQHAAGTSSAAARGRQVVKDMDDKMKVRVDVDVTTLTEDVQVKLRIGKGEFAEDARGPSGKQSAPEAADAASSGQSMPATTAAGYGRQSMHATAAAGYGKQSLHEERGEPGVVPEKPWLRSEYQSIQTSSKDLWDMSVPGWAIRAHRHPRKGAFHPIHPSTPFNAATLEETRVTHCLVKPKAVTAFDEWTDPKKAKDIEGVAADTEWRGFTFFKFRQSNEETTGSTKGTKAHFPKEDELDGYELIDDEDSW